MKNQQQDVKVLYTSILFLKESSKYEPSKPWLKQHKKELKKVSDFNKYTYFQRPAIPSCQYITGSKD